MRKGRETDVLTAGAQIVWRVAQSGASFKRVVGF